jgi:CRP-like cAMP-binding protein
VSLVSDAPRPRHQRFPTIDRLPLAEVIPGARTTGAFSIPAIEIPLPAHRKSSSENVIGDVAGAMPRVPLFSSLDENRLHSLIVRSRVIVRDDGQAIVQQGDLGDTLYVIIRGEVDITIEGTSVPVNHLGEGEFFGELALLTEQPRLATVTARGEVELLEIGRDAIWDLIEDAPEVLQILLRFFRDRLIERLVATSPLFTEFSAAEARQLTERFQFLELHPETALITEGHRADGLFVLLCGACDVQSAAHGVIATLGPGDLCGEVSLLTRAPAAATVSTRGRVWALGLPRAEFQELILTHPQILIYVNELAESRRAAEGERKVALV